MRVGGARIPLVAPCEERVRLDQQYGGGRGCHRGEGACRESIVVEIGKQRCGSTWVPVHAWHGVGSRAAEVQGR